jgi:hypothetical protein
MTTVNRYDYATIQATKTDEGFLVDSPIVARIGIQEYLNADGSTRRELRLPEEVFNADSLASMRGKPISVDHPKSGKITSKDAHRVTVGTVLSGGRQDGDNVITDITIHSPDAMGDRRELSLGYSAKLDETPGTWNGQHYDAIQREIRINHLSIVKKGRAGVARLNMDSDEDFSTQQEQQTMSTVKVKLDSGLEYDAAPEVSVELSKLRSDALATAVKLDAIPKLQAEKDVLQAKLDGVADQLAQAKEQGRVDALARLNLEATAEKFKVDAKDKTDREVKELVIKSVRKDADLTDKSDVYVDAAFDMAVEIAPSKNMADQRKSVNTKTDATVKTDSRSAYEAHMLRLANKENK